ncbi:MAG: D-alanyl-D-alanine carboxypeptidase family protein [Microcystaceae cyanobacterium]
MVPGKDNYHHRASLRVDEQGDIPEVLRDQPRQAPPSKRSGLGLVWGLALGLGSLGLLGMIVGTLTLTRSPAPPVATPSPPPVVSPTPGLDNVLGHLPYPEAPLKDLKAITPDGRWQLRKAAADNFLQMQRAARTAGVSLVPISAFRSVKNQEQIFFGIKQARNQEARQRAEVSAPPGYSEHHTGYAVDIGDGTVPSANLSQRFEQTPAFRWLQKNAARYDFELSFTPNNPQGVSYEPWHWRFVGDRHSLETFYRARNLQPKAAPSP